MEMITSTQQYNQTRRELFKTKIQRDSIQADINTLYENIKLRKEGELYFIELSELDRRTTRLQARAERLINRRADAFFESGVSAYDTYQKAHRILGLVLKRIASVGAKKDSLINANKGLYIEMEELKSEALVKHDEMMRCHEKAVRLEQLLEAAPARFHM